jgi:hypothetical protein
LAAWILTTHDAIGRPGEIKYDDYIDWYFDLLTELVDTSWKESKNLKKYTMPCFSDDFFGFDWYCVMGAFFMSEDGLFRSKQEQIEQGKLNAVFVRLHQLQDNLVAGNASSTTTTAPLAAMPLSYNNDAYSNAEVKGKSGGPFFKRQVPCYFNSNEIQCKQIVLVQLH